MKTKKTARRRTERDGSSPIVVRPRTKATAEAVNQAAIETMAIGVDAIRDEIEALRRGDAKANRRDPGSVIASLASKAGAIYEATRKARAAELKRLNALSPAIVLAWLRQLEAGERAQLLSEVSLIDARKSGLG